MLNPVPVFQDIINAHKNIRNVIHCTPVLSSKSINRIAGCNIVFKCENLQKVGAFKFRGASNAISNLNKKQLAKGVATHSSGNHAAALALAAKMIGVPAYIVMPENAPSIKKKAVESYNAKITYCKPTQQARETTLNKIVEQTGATFIHPYNDPKIIAGQGTAALELLSDYKNQDIVIAPVGGGGLLSGTLIGVKGINNSIKVYGAEPENANDAYRSFKSGHLIPSVNPNTIADGLLTSLGSITYQVIMSKADDILTTKEENIVKAMRLIWERMKIIVEPSSAVPLACILENPELFSEKNIGVILSGGNVELSSLPF